MFAITLHYVKFRSPTNHAHLWEHLTPEFASILDLCYNCI